MKWNNIYIYYKKLQFYNYIGFSDFEYNIYDINKIRYVYTYIKMSWCDFLNISKFQKTNI